MIRFDGVFETILVVGIAIGIAISAIIFGMIKVWPWIKAVIHAATAS